MRDLLDDLCIELSYLATQENISVAKLHESVLHLSDKHGNEEYFKQVFYAILSIELNGERNRIFKNTIRVSSQGF